MSNNKKLKKEERNKFKDKALAITAFSAYPLVLLMVILMDNIISSDQPKFFLFSFISDAILIPLILSHVIFVSKTLKLKHVIAFFISLFISPLLITSVNYIFSSQVQSYSVTVASKYTTHGKSTAYWIKTTSWKNTIETMMVKEAVWNSIEQGSKHITKIRKGGLSIDLLDSFY